MSQSCDKILNFIEDYKSLPALWDPKHYAYTNKIIRCDNLKVLAVKYQLSIGKIKAKIKSLRSYFAKEHAKVKKNKTGSARSYVYMSPWFAYKALLFLADIATSNQNGEIGENPAAGENDPDFEEPEDVVESQMTIEDHQPSTSSIKKELTPPHWEEYQPTPENKPKKRKIMEDPWVDEAYKILKSGLTYEKDSSAVFGEYVASKHRQYSAFTKSTVEHLINNILYQADIGKYDKPNSQQP
nr:uncharacterized protein LOC106688786 isoform X1 [Halyomorpha halys]